MERDRFDGGGLTPKLDTHHAPVLWLYREVPIISDVLGAYFRLCCWLLGYDL